MARNARALMVGLLGFDFDTNINPITKTVTTTASKVVAANPKRINIKISVTASWLVTFGFDSSVIYYQGIPVIPGGTLELDWREDFDLVTREMWAVTQGQSNAIASAGFLNIIETVVIGSEN